MAHGGCNAGDDGAGVDADDGRGECSSSRRPKMNSRRVTLRKQLETRRP